MTETSGAEPEDVKARKLAPMEHVKASILWLQGEIWSCATGEMCKMIITLHCSIFLWQQYFTQFFLQCLFLFIARSGMSQSSPLIEW